VISDITLDRVPDRLAGLAAAAIFERDIAAQSLGIYDLGAIRSEL
jgi:hypothetical protein